MWDPELGAAEVKRMSALGCHAVTFSENPAKLGWPSLHSDHWDPFWTACADEGTVVCMHLGSSSELIMTAADAPIDVMISLQPMNMVQAAADLLWSPVLRKYDDLRFALSEGGIGWIPYALERIDYVYQHHHAWTGQDFGDQLPSQLFKDRIITCFIDDAFGVDNRRYLNIDNITWECDYPHSDSTWPQSPEMAMKYLAEVPDDEIDKITHLNACAISDSIRSRSARGNAARWAPCGRRRPTSTHRWSPAGVIRWRPHRHRRPGHRRPHLRPHRRAGRRHLTLPDPLRDQPPRATMPIHYQPGDDHIVRITIDRPEARNSLDMEHFAQLRKAWDRFGDEDDAWVAVITGVGPDFCVGADLKTYIPQITRLQAQMKEVGVTEVDGYRLDDGTKAVLRNVKLYKPIIAAVNGTCVAGGMEMLGGCDLRVAADTATFGVMEPKRGLFAGGRHHRATTPTDPLSGGHGVAAVRRPGVGPSGLRDGTGQRGLSLRAR